MNHFFELSFLKPLSPSLRKLQMRLFPKVEPRRLHFANLLRLPASHPSGLSNSSGAANSVGRVMPNASSESDLGRYLTGGTLGSTPPVRGKSPSLSQVTTDPRKDNSHSSTASKLVLKEVQSHGFKQHVGEKVAQVSFLHHLRLFFSSFLFRALRSPTQKWRHVKDAFASSRT